MIKCGLSLPDHSRYMHAFRVVEEKEEGEAAGNEEEEKRCDHSRFLGGSQPEKSKEERSTISKKKKVVSSLEKRHFPYFLATDIKASLEKEKKWKRIHPRRLRSRTCNGRTSGAGRTDGWTDGWMDGWIGRRAKGGCLAGSVCNTLL